MTTENIDKIGIDQFEREQIMRRLTYNLNNVAVVDFTEPDDVSNAVSGSLLNWLRYVLYKGPVLVEFEKVNGELRIMECTLSPDFLSVAIQPPSDTVTDKVKKHKQNQDVLSVWDLKQNAWRSFRIDKVKRVEYQIG